MQQQFLTTLLQTVDSAGYSLGADEQRRRLLAGATPSVMRIDTVYA